jgi:putative ABC transport system permease protein
LVTVNLEIAKLVIKSLFHRRLRTFLTTLGIAIGVALVFSLISLNGGMKASIVEQMDMLGADAITIMGKTVTGSPLSGTFTQEDIEVVEKVNVMKSAMGLYYTGLGVKVKGEEFFKAVAGIESDKIGVFVEMYSGFGTESGRFLEDGETGKIVVGPMFAEDYNLHIGSQIEMGGEDFRIVGIMEPVGNGEDDRNIYANVEDLWRLSGKSNIYNAIFGEAHEPKVEPIERALERHRGVDDFEVMTTENMMELFDTVLGVINAVFLGVASISILVGSIGVANTMYVSVLERVREIGVLKSIGATRMQIMFMFLFEAGLVGVVGGVAGILLGYLIAFGFTSAVTASGFLDFHAHITPSLFLISAGSAFVVGMVAGFMPARWASKLEPVEALRYE